MVKIKDELAKLVPGFAPGDRGDLPDEARVEVLEVRRAFPVMAFLQLTPKDFQPEVSSCDPDAQPSTWVMYASSDGPGQERIRLAGEHWESEYSGFKVEFFTSPRRKVVFPPIAATVPVFEVHYDHDNPCWTEGSGKKVAIFHAGRGAWIGDPIPLKTRAVVTGHTGDERAAISWLKGKEPGTVLLAVTKVETGITYPCTGEWDNSAECRPQYACSRSTRVFVVTADSAEEEQVESLRQTEPALAKLPPDQSGDSEAACRRLSLR